MIIPDVGGLPPDDMTRPACLTRNRLLGYDPVERARENARITLQIEKEAAVNRAGWESFRERNIDPYLPPENPCVTKVKTCSAFLCCAGVVGGLGYVIINAIVKSFGYSD